MLRRILLGCVWILGVDNGFYRMLDRLIKHFLPYCEGFGLRFYYFSNGYFKQ